VSPFTQSLVALLPRLRRFARVLAGSAHEADDLVQAACERALRAEASFSPGTRLDSWMFTIIRNLWVDGRRSTAARGGDPAPLDAAETVTGADGADIAEVRIALGQVERAMLRLPAEQREALALVCVEDVSFREAADILGVPIGTVMSRVARARLALGRQVSGVEAVLGP
jgi:RNA polymerase sigma-70 factor (ECF subfamily)